MKLKSFIGLTALLAVCGVSSAFAFSTTSPVESHEWNSGKDNHLSDWESITCVNSYGSSYLLTALEAFKERKANADNFIARLEGTCTRYVTVNGSPTQTSVNETELIYSSNHRTPGGLTEVDHNLDRPVGVYLEINSGDGYLKDLAMIAAVSSDHHDARVLSRATGYNGISDGNLSCSPNHFLTGLKLKYDTRKGKIRRLKIFCRPES